MLFRIEDISGFNPNLRKYNPNEFSYPIINKIEIDNYIAQKIREAVNGSKNRELLSYSKSLATCLLKYNKYTDNELHICVTHGYRNYISYFSLEEGMTCKYYSIRDGMNKSSFFNIDGVIQLFNFIIDISNNDLIDKYLRSNTDKGKTIFASPEKDNEVVVMNPPNDCVIRQHIDSVYILYALQLRYGFLNDINIQMALILELSNMAKLYAGYHFYEIMALINIVSYLIVNWNYEYSISKPIYNYSESCGHLSLYYDSILQFDDIMHNDFMESYDNISCYNKDKISYMFLRYCGRFLGYKM